MNKKVYYSIILGYEGLFRVVIKDKERLDLLYEDKAVGNYFETEEKAQEALNEIRDILILKGCKETDLKREFEKLTKGEYNPKKINCYLVWDGLKKRWNYTETTNLIIFSIGYFEMNDTFKEFVKMLNDNEITFQQLNEAVKKED